MIKGRDIGQSLGTQSSSNEEQVEQCIEEKNSKEKKLRGRSDSTVGRALALHAADLSSILHIPLDPLALPGVIPESQKKLLSTSGCGLKTK